MPRIVRWNHRLRSKMSETAKVVPESGKQNIHFRVVITGGPCSGKTTLVPLLVKRFNQESSGWMANSSPEAATTFGLNTPQGKLLKPLNLPLRIKYTIVLKNRS